MDDKNFRTWQQQNAQWPNRFRPRRAPVPNSGYGGEPDMKMDHLSGSLLSDSASMSATHSYPSALTNAERAAAADNANLKAWLDLNEDAEDYGNRNIGNIDIQPLHLPGPSLSTMRHRSSLVPRNSRNGMSHSSGLGGIPRDSQQRSSPIPQNPRSYQLYRRTNSKEVRDIEQVSPLFSPSLQIHEQRQGASDDPNKQTTRWATNKTRVTSKQSLQGLNERNTTKGSSLNTRISDIRSFDIDNRVDNTIRIEQENVEQTEEELLAQIQELHHKLRIGGSDIDTTFILPGRNSSIIRTNTSEKCEDITKEIKSNRTNSTSKNEIQNNKKETFSGVLKTPFPRSNTKLIVVSNRLPVQAKRDVNGILL